MQNVLLIEGHLLSMALIISIRLYKNLPALNEGNLAFMHGYCGQVAMTIFEFGDNVDHRINLIF